VGQQNCDHEKGVKEELQKKRKHHFLGGGDARARWEGKKGSPAQLRNNSEKLGENTQMQNERKKLECGHLGLLLFNPGEGVSSIGLVGGVKGEKTRLPFVGDRKGRESDGLISLAKIPKEKTKRGGQGRKKLAASSSL